VEARDVAQTMICLMKMLNAIVAMTVFGFANLEIQLKETIFVNAVGENGNGIITKIKRNV
jgi:hypothetical protein